MYIDFMGTDAAIFRTLGKQTAMRTDQYNSRWLNGEGGREAPGGRRVWDAARSSRGTRWGSGPVTGWRRGGGGVRVPGPGLCWGGACAADPCPPADPSFIHAELIPDSAERNDDKLYFFFRERSAEAPQSPAVYARIGRICLVRAGGAPGCPSPDPALARAACVAGSWV